MISLQRPLLCGYINEKEKTCMVTMTLYVVQDKHTTGSTHA